MTIQEMRVSRGLRRLLWVILAIHVAAAVGFGPTDWFEVWYKRTSWCAGLILATAIITGDWLARLCTESDGEPADIPE